MGELFSKGYLTSRNRLIQLDVIYPKIFQELGR